MDCDRSFDAQATTALRLLDKWSGDRGRRLSSSLICLAVCRTRQDVSSRVVPADRNGLWRSFFAPITTQLTLTIPTRPSHLPALFYVATEQTTQIHSSRRTVVSVLPHNHRSIPNSPITLSSHPPWLQ